MIEQTSNPANVFRLLMRVRYAECDAQQVVFNARYADYVDLAMTEYFRQQVGGFQQLLHKGLDNQVVSLHIDWFASAKFDDVLAIDVSTAKVGNTSYTFELQIFDFNSQTLLAKSNISYVLVNTKNYQKTPVPDWLRKALQEPAKTPMINQTGIIL